MPEQRLIDANDITTKAQPADHFVKHGNGKTPVVGLYYVISSPTVNAVVLPCKVGDTVWVNFSITGSHQRGKDRPFACTVNFIGLNQSESGGFINFQYEKNGCQFQLDFDAFGKTVFLTKEAAESALAERRADG